MWLGLLDERRDVSRLLLGSWSIRAESSMLAGYGRNFGWGKFGKSYNTIQRCGGYDCCLLVQKIAQTFKGSISERKILSILVQFLEESYHLCFSYSIWRERMELPITSLGFSFHFRNAMPENQRANGKRGASYSKEVLQSKLGMTAQITGIQKISSVFSRKKSEDVVDLSEDDHLLLLPKEGSDSAVEVSSQIVQTR